MTDKFCFSKALPIWAKGNEKVPNQSLCFTTCFSGKENATIAITANSFYRLSVNGVFVGYGPARAAHRYARIDRYELKKLENNNEIKIEAAGYCVDTFYSLNTTPFVQFEVTRGKEVILASSKDEVSCHNTTRLQKVLRFSYQRPFTEYYDESKEIRELPLENKILDMQYLERGVDYPTYEKLGAKLVESGEFSVVKPEKIDHLYFQNEPNVAVFSYDELERDPSKEMASFQFKKKGTDEKKTLVEKEYATYRFMASETGFVGVKFFAKKDSRIHVVFDEVDTSLGKGENGQISVNYMRNSTYNIISYEVGKGEYENISFEPYTAQYVRIVVAAGEIDVEEIFLIKYENPVGRRIHDFDFGDDKKNLIAEAAVRTFAANSVDLFTDCPSRERAGWLCDSFFSGRVEMEITGDNKVERNFLENIAMAPSIRNIPDDMVPMCYPADFEKCLFIPNWSLWYLVQLKDCYDRTYDRELVDFSKKKVDGLVRYFKKFENENSLVENLENWVFIEWSKANDADFISGVNYPSNMLYSYALDCVADLFPEEYGSLKDKAEKIRQFIRQNSYNGEFFEDNAVRKDGKLVKTGHTTETCQYYAFFFGVATKKTYPELFEKMMNEFDLYTKG